jgi:sialate O-acetylesterase
MAVLGVAAPAWPRIDLAPHIQDQMVVQRGAAWEVSGTADEGERFTVTFLRQRIEVRASGGAWSARFDVPANSTGPAELAIETQRLTRNVLVGDVWLCSGQSNMALPIDRASDGRQIVQSAQGKTIRIYQVPKPMAERQSVATGRWGTPAPGDVGRFSAVCLAFGAALGEHMKIPLGLIDASLGATWIESWISARSFRQFSSQDVSRKRFAQRQIQRANSGRRRKAYGIEQPSQLFELMVRPLTRQAIKGTLWYQGEGNRRNPGSYAELLSLLIRDWRAHWSHPALPFVVVQLPGFGTPAAGLDTASGWAAVRDEQRVAVASSPPAALAVTIDLGDGHIHPGTKLPFGQRAAEMAFGLVYEPGRTGLAPAPTGVSPESNAVRVQFDGGRACLKGAPSIAETVFVAGEDRRWHAAEVEIGQSSLIARSARVPRPVAVRYGWSDYPLATLYSCAHGLPVTPFRTDDWPLGG